VIRRREAQPLPPASSRDLALHDAQANSSQEAAHGRRLSQRADAPEEADEDLLQEVFAFAGRSEHAAQRPIDARREAVPGLEHRARVAAAQGEHEREVVLVDGRRPGAAGKNAKGCQGHRPTL